MKRMFFQSLLVKNSCTVFVTLISFGLNAVEKNKPVAALDPIDSIVPMLGGLVAILVVIFSLAYLFKKFSGFNIASQNIRVLETQIIGHKEKLMIIQVRQQQFLIGVTGHTINQLGELDSSDFSNQGDINTSKFFSTIKSKGKNKNKHSAFSKIMSTLTYPKTKQKSSTSSARESTE